MEDERKPSKTIHTRSLIPVVKALEESRQSWIDTLVKNPAHSEAARMILTITGKIEMLDTLLRDAYVFRGINDHELWS